MISYAKFKNIQKQEVTVNVSKNGITDSVLQYKYDAVEKAGDALLANEDFETVRHILMNLTLSIIFLNNYELILSYCIDYSLFTLLGQRNC